MQTMLRHWAHTGELSALLNLLFENGFDVWITADHGNTEARGIGKPNLGLSAEERGERVLVFQTAAQRENIARQYPQTTLWNGAGLPPDYQPILAANRAAFVYQDTTVVGHGGASIEEVLVPFIRVKKRR